MTNLSKRLEAHFVACAAAAVGVAFTGAANAQIVYSGPVNIVIPDNIDGVYMNVVSGATGSSGGSVAGWDINPYTATAGTNSGFHLWGPTATTWLDLGGNSYNLPFGTPIDGTGTYGRPGGGTNLNTQVNLSSADNYFGFNFLEEGGNATHYGWIRVAFGAGVGDRAIVGYAYESTPGGRIGAGVIPAPGSLALLGLGALGVGRRRR